MKRLVLLAVLLMAGGAWAAVGQMQVLKIAMSGPNVKDLQQRLNSCGPTRLPRLDADGNFGPLTKARVMEFQFGQHLTIDGEVRPATLGRLPPLPSPRAPSAPAPKGRCILIDLIGRQLTTYEDGAEKLRASPISGGRPSHPTTQGVFPLSSRRLRQHTSSEYPAPPGQRNMDFALFYHGDEAIHQGDPNVLSHGCVHVGPPNAERLFDWAGATKCS